MARAGAQLSNPEPPQAPSRSSYWGRAPDVIEFDEAIRSNCVHHAARRRRGRPCSLFLRAHAATAAVNHPTRHCVAISPHGNSHAGSRRIGARDGLMAGSERPAPGVGRSGRWLQSGLKVAPCQRGGKDDEHNDYTCGNEHRIDWHSRPPMMEECCQPCADWALTCIKSNKKCSRKACHTAAMASARLASRRRTSPVTMMSTFRARTRSMFGSPFRFQPR